MISVSTSDIVNVVPEDRGSPNVPLPFSTVHPAKYKVPPAPSSILALALIGTFSPSAKLDSVETIVPPVTVRLCGVPNFTRIYVSDAGSYFPSPRSPRAALPGAEFPVYSVAVFPFSGAIVIGL